MSRRSTNDFAMLAEFRVAQRRRNLAPGTIKHRHTHLLDLSDWLRVHGVNGLLRATTTDLEDFLDVRNVTPETRGTYIGYIRSFYVWAVKAGHTRYDPTVAMDRPRLRKARPRPIADDELTIAVAEAADTDPRMHAWLLLGCFSGLRCAEVAGLRVENIDRARRTAIVLGKGNKERTVVLHPDVMAALTRYGLPPRGYVFTKPDSANPYTPSTISRYVAQFLHNLGSPATMHRLRHWYGTTLYEQSGGDLLLVRDGLGHTSVATSEIYADAIKGKGATVIRSLSLDPTLAADFPPP